MLGMFRPEAEVGYYSVAVKLATLTTFILTAINSMAAPKFSELYHSNKMDELFYVAKKSAKLIFWLSFPILLTLITFGKLILGIAFGENFVVSYSALIILSFGQFASAISGSSGMFMKMTGSQVVMSYIYYIVAAVNVLLNLLLIPSYGFYGAAIASSISITALNLIILCYIKSKYGKTTGYFPCMSKF